MGEIFPVIGSALTAGLFSIILWKLQTGEAKRKDAQDKADDRLKKIEANSSAVKNHEQLLNQLVEAVDELKVMTKTNSELLEKHEQTFGDLKEATENLRESSELNGEGVKVLMRHLLQIYHADYVLRGFISSHEKAEFLEAYEVYHSEGGNGTGEGWKNEVCALPVRDDLPTINPCLEILKQEKTDENLRGF